MRGQLFSFIFTLILLTGLSSWAENAIQITSVSYASAYNLGTGGSTPIIYGGIAGSTAACVNSLDATTMCNNCALAALGSERACNEQHVHGTLKLRISFTVVTDIQGTINFGYGDGTAAGTAEFSSYTKSSSGTLSKGSSGSVEIAWSELCGLINANTSCNGAAGANDGTITAFISVEEAQNWDSAHRIQLRIRVVDPDASAAGYNLYTDGTSASPDVGVISLVAAPDDTKVYFQDVVLSGCDTNYTALRMYYGEDDGSGGLALAGYGGNYKDLSLNTDCSNTDEWFVDGLENDISYFFRPAMLDKAGNSVFLTSGAVITTAFPDCVSPVGTTQDTNCPFIATPGLVNGLLPKDFNCFIATAAYGSPFAEKVQTLRDFRDQILMKYSLGEKIVRAYYKHSRTAANYISTRPLLRSLVRIVLWPLWSAAWLTLHYGLIGTLLLFVLGAGYILVSLRKIRARAREALL